MKRRTFLMGGAIATGALHGLGGRALVAGAPASAAAPIAPTRVSIADPRKGNDLIVGIPNSGVLSKERPGPTAGR